MSRKSDESIGSLPSVSSVGAGSSVTVSPDMGAKASALIAESPSLEEAEFLSIIAAGAGKEREAKEKEAIAYLKTHRKLFPKSADANGYTAKFWARRNGMPILEGMLEGFRCLTPFVAGQVGVNWTSERGFALLLSIIEKNDVLAFRAVLSIGGYLPLLKLVIDTQLTLTGYVASLGHLEILQLIVENDSREIEAGSDVAGNNFTPLIEAARNGHLPVVTYLLEKGARVDFVNHRGETALSVAKANGHIHVEASLTERLALPTYRGSMS